MKHKALLVLTVLFFCTPASADAAVQITEIMYDVSGTDSGREWIEITNTGSAPVDVTGYKLFEANTNHALSLVQGSGTLAAGASAVIADDDAKFKVDWPAYSGMLFDSSFSLSNTGEALAIKDSALTVLDTISYDSSGGAAGDGNSLQRSGAVFIAAAPNPGSYGSSGGTNTAATAEQTATTSAVVPQNTQAQSQTQAGGMGPPPITVRIAADARVMVGGGSYFSASAYGTQSLPLPDTRFVWNFGDGATGEGPKVFHVYAYPGRYIVSASGAYNYSSGTDRVTVEAVQAAVSLEAEGDGSLLIRNQTGKDINIGLWSLLDGAAVYTIPADTLVLGGEGVRFASAVTGLKGTPGAILRYPNGTSAAEASVAADSPLRGERVTKEEMASAPVPVVSGAPEPVVSKNAPVSAAQKPVSGTSSAAAVAEAEGLLSPFWASFGGLVLLLGAGVVAVRHIQISTARGTSRAPEEFDIE